MQKQKQRLREFEGLFHKEYSREVQTLLKDHIANHPPSHEQYLWILVQHDCLDLILYLVNTYRLEKSVMIKLLNYLCREMSQLDANLVAPIWKSLYIGTDTQEPHRFQLFYQCLASFSFGGANRKAQSNSLHVIMTLFMTAKVREDNKFLAQVTNDFSKNFQRFNLFEVNYIKTMNSVLQMALPTLTIDLHLFSKRYVWYLDSLKQKQMHELKREILKGLSHLGNLISKSNYLVGSIHSYILDNINPLLESKIFTIRNQARLAVKAWNMVLKRYMAEEKEKMDVGSKEIHPDIILDNKLQQNQNQIMKLLERANQYGKNKQYNQRKAANLNIVVEKEKQFLKKKTGIGGGFIETQPPKKINKQNIYTRYQQILNNLDKPKNTQEFYIQDDSYSSCSHLSKKYDMEDTIECDEEAQIVDKVWRLGKQNKYNELNVAQIEKLIDLAYKNMKHGS